MITYILRGHDTEEEAIRDVNPEVLSTELVLILHVKFLLQIEFWLLIKDSSTLFKNTGTRWHTAKKS